MSEHGGCGSCRWGKQTDYNAGAVYACQWPIPIWLIQVIGKPGRDLAVVDERDGEECPTWSPQP